MNMHSRRLAGRESEHLRIDEDVPAAQVAALQRRSTSRDKSPGHEQGDQEAGRRRECIAVSEDESR